MFKDIMKTYKMARDGELQPGARFTFILKIQVIYFSIRSDICQYAVLV